MIFGLRPNSLHAIYEIKLDLGGSELDEAVHCITVRTTPRFGSVYGMKEGGTSGLRGFQEGGWVLEKKVVGGETAPYQTRHKNFARKCTCSSTESSVGAISQPSHRGNAFFRLNSREKRNRRPRFLFRVSKHLCTALPKRKRI